MVIVMTHDVMKLVPHLVPPQIPATFAVDGAVGVESQLVASATVRATASMPIIRRRLLSFTEFILPGDSLRLAGHGRQRRIVARPWNAKNFGNRLRFGVKR